MKLASAYSQMTSLYQKPPKKRLDPKQKLLRKGDKKEVE